MRVIVVVIWGLLVLGCQGYQRSSTPWVSKLQPTQELQLPSTLSTPQPSMYPLMEVSDSERDGLILDPKPPTITPPSHTRTGS